MSANSDGVFLISPIIHFLSKEYAPPPNRVTNLLCIPINMVIQNLTGITNLKAVLPVEAAAILILISVLLTLVAGIIPSKSAAKKDPVVALRSE